MRHLIIHSKILSLIFGISVLLFLAIFYVFGWQEPTQAPPKGNLPAPINASENSQTKLGPLALNTSSTSPTGLIVNGNTFFLNGNVAIGTTTPPTEKLEISGKLKIGGIILKSIVSQPNCDSSQKGKIIYYQDKLWACDGTYWKNL